ncbi:MAG: hypothetical protein NZM26_01445 [Patescibacteria group bacterium]|nr:hypothetical protein [Patescibacteria group bacterium]
MTRERDQQFNNFVTQFLSNIDPDRSDNDEYEKYVRDGSNFFRLISPSDDLSLLIHRNPMPVGDPIEWSLQQDEQNIPCGEILEDESRQLVKMYLGRVLSFWGIDLKEDSSGLLYISFGSNKYVFTISPNAKTISGGVIKLDKESD